MGSVSAGVGLYGCFHFIVSESAFLPFFHRRRHRPQLCPDDRTRGPKLAGTMRLFLRLGSGNSSSGAGRTGHASLALARNCDVIYVASVNWYIFVSTTQLQLVHG